MMKVKFKTLIPNVVKDWIIKRGFEDELLEAEKRLFRKLSSSNMNSYFAHSGRVLGVEKENDSWVGNCFILLEANNEQEARKEFKKIFGDIAEKGQKFKFISFEKVDS